MSNLTENDLIKRVAEKYENDGYEVIIKPGQQYIPFDLGNYRPDLLARKGINDGYIFEIKKDKSYVSIDQIKDVASSTDAHNGWHFVLVTGDDISYKEPELDKEIPVLSWQQIASEKQKGERFILQNEYEVAFWFFWRAIDAMMRRYAREISMPIDRLPTSSLINHLYSHGELSIDQYDKLSDLRQIRNQLAHGLSAQVDDNIIKCIQKVSYELYTNWNPDASYENN